MIRLHCDECKRPAAGSSTLRSWFSRSVNIEKSGLTVADGSLVTKVCLAKRIFILDIGVARASHLLLDGYDDRCVLYVRGALALNVASARDDEAQAGEQGGGADEGGI